MVCNIIGIENPVLIPSLVNLSGSLILGIVGKEMLCLLCQVIFSNLIIIKKYVLSYSLDHFNLEVLAKSLEREGDGCLFDWQGIVHHGFIPEGVTVKKERYKAVLAHL
jgi:hypothetical protein